MYLSESKFVVEIDKKGHIDRNENKENEKQIKIEEHLNCKFHRINPDVEGFLEINKIRTYITKSNKGKIKSKIAKELLIYVSDVSKPSKHIRYCVQKILPT